MDKRVIIFILFCILVLLNIMQARSRRQNQWLAGMLFLTMFYFQVTAYRGDYLVYENIYTDLTDRFTTFGQVLASGDEKFDIEILFLLFMFVFGRMHASFLVFYSAMTLLAYILLFFGVRKFTNKYGLLLALYAISFWVWGSDLLRNFLAFSVIVFALHYIFKPGAKNKIKYLFFNALAALFHITALFYLPFLFFSKRRPNLRIVAVIALTVSVLTVTANLLGLNVWGKLAELLYFIYPNDKILVYFDSATGLGFVSPLVIVGSIYIVNGYLSGRARNLRGDNSGNVENYFLLSNAMQNIADYCCIILVLCAIQTVFLRIILNMVLLSFIYFAKHIGVARVYKNQLSLNTEEHCAGFSADYTVMIGFALIIAIFTVIFYFGPGYYLQFFQF